MFINKPVAIYVRVSTDDQSERGTIESQIEFATKYCDLHELPIFKIYKDDGVTGTLPLQERPAASQLLQDAKNKRFDTLLVYKLDRLGRATRVILNAIHDFENHGVNLKSMTEPFDMNDASGRFTLTILAGVADLERSNILERMWIGTNRAARQGIWLGGIVPYGYFKNKAKMLEVNEAPLQGLNMSEAEVIRLIYALTVKEKMTTIKIADYLNALGIPPSYVARYSPDIGRRKNNTAGIWRPGRVLNMLKSTTYKGIHQYGKRTNKDREIIERAVPAIVDEDTWNKAQAVIKSNFVFSRRNTVHTYLLRNLIKCGKCGYNYHGTVSKNAKYYICNGRTSWRAKGQPKCYAKSINMDWMDEMVWNDCLHYINHPEIALNEFDQKENTQNSEDNFLKEKTLLIKRLKQKDIEKESILDLFRKKFITMKDVENQLSKIGKEIDTIKLHIENIDKKIAFNENVFSARESAEKFLISLREKVNSTAEKTIEFKREIITALVDKIIITTQNDDNDPEKQTVEIGIYYKFNKVNEESLNNLTKVVPCTDMGSLNR